MKNDLMTKSFEELAVEISNMSKSQLVNAIVSFRGSFKMDFTEEFLDKLSLDNLRHIYIAAVMTLQGHNQDTD